MDLKNGVVDDRGVTVKRVLDNVNCLVVPLVRHLRDLLRGVTSSARRSRSQLGCEHRSRNDRYCGGHRDLRR